MKRVMAGLSRTKADGIQLGRRRLEDSDADKVTAIVAARATGTGIRRIARDLGVGVGPVFRVMARPASCGRGGICRVSVHLGQLPSIPLR